MWAAGVITNAVARFFPRCCDASVLADLTDLFVLRTLRRLDMQRAGGVPGRPLAHFRVLSRRIGRPVCVLTSDRECGQHVDRGHRRGPARLERPLLAAQDPKRGEDQGEQGDGSLHTSTGVELLHQHRGGDGRHEQIHRYEGHDQRCRDRRQPARFFLARCSCSIPPPLCPKTQWRARPRRLGA